MTYRCADISDSLTSMCYTNPDIRIGWRVLYRYYLWVMTRKQECCLFCSVPYVNVALLWILFLIWNLGTVSALIFHHQPAFSNTPHCWFHYRSRNRGTERGERERESTERDLRANFSTVRITADKMPCFAQIWRKVSDRWQASLWQENVFLLALFISGVSACVLSVNPSWSLQRLCQVSICVGCGGFSLFATGCSLCCAYRFKIILICCQGNFVLDIKAAD